MNLKEHILFILRVGGAKVTPMPQSFIRKLCIGFFRYDDFYSAFNAALQELVLSGKIGMGTDGKEWFFRLVD